MSDSRSRLRALALTMALVSLSLVLLELLLTRLFALVLFAQFAHLALALGLLGISLGAVLHHLAPQIMGDETLERRLGWLALIQAGLTLVAVICSLEFPLTIQFDEPPTTYQERSSVRDDLLDPMWFGLLLPILTMPFASAGLAFSAVFHRRRQWIGSLYGADLAGGALGAVVFIPLLGILAGPDVVFAILLAGGVAAFVLGRVSETKPLWLTGAVVGALSLGALGVAATGDLLKVRYSAGYAEENITYSQWTALTRVSVHEDDKRGAFIVLDNTSASEVFLEPKRRAKVARTVANRSVVHQLVEPGSRIAILAASAGPEVGVAQHFGQTTIDAIDIAGEISEVVAKRFPDAEANPYLQPGIHPVKADGRAAILHANEPYDVIQMVHANLWSSAGLLSSAWSPSLLETREAFGTYLDHITDDGILSFGRGNATDNLARSASAALLARGVKEPWRHIFYIRADTSLMLVRPRPWTEAERDAAWAVTQRYRNARWVVDPLAEPSKKVRRMLFERPVMTDDRPYLDDWETLKRELERAFDTASGESDKPIAVLYRSVFLQAAFVLVGPRVHRGAVPAARSHRCEGPAPPGQGAPVRVVSRLRLPRGRDRSHSRAGAVRRPSHLCRHRHHPRDAARQRPGQHLDRKGRTRAAPARPAHGAGRGARSGGHPGLRHPPAAPRRGPRPAAGCAGRDHLRGAVPARLRDGHALPAGHVPAR